MATYAEIIGAKIKLHRIAKNLTQEELAEVSNMTASYLGQIERGTKDFRIHTIEKIANALEININSLFTDENEYYLQKKKWVWESLLLLMEQDDTNQHKAYRILREVFSESETASSK